MLFQEKCLPCHTVGQGDLVGPDLKNVTARRSRGWLVRWLLAPDRMLAQSDPIASELLKQYKNVPMPNQGLTEEQASALFAFLATGAPGASFKPTAAASALPGDPVVGRALFTGVARLQNGGPSCMACHSVGGIGALGGGALGPDLTTAYGRYGEAGIASVLAALPFPAMNPIFRDRPLTPQEQAHLKAFLQQASAERPSRALASLAVLAVVGAGVLLGLAQISWPRRLGEVRRPLVRRRR
jgi:mono/diheme cytochrome c family protein